MDADQSCLGEKNAVYFYLAAFLSFGEGVEHSKLGDLKTIVLRSPSFECSFLLFASCAPKTSSALPNISKKSFDLWLMIQRGPVNQARMHIGATRDWNMLSISLLCLVSSLWKVESIHNWGDNKQFCFKVPKFSGLYLVVFILSSLTLLSNPRIARKKLALVNGDSVRRLKPC